VVALPPDSDVGRLNRDRSDPQPVHPDTITMIERSIELWRITGGLADPLVLDAVVDAGYDRPFAELEPGRAAARRPWQPTACTDIVIHGGRVHLPAGAGFDPGGIGKGLAADIVVGELIGAGAAGACVNLGGDLRVGGRPTDGGGWRIDVEEPVADAPIVTLSISDGAVATSSTTKRTWTVGGERRHHLIDPTTGRPSETDLVQASVVAGNAWVAEGLAKAILLRGSAHPFDQLTDGIEALAIHRDGSVLTTPGFARFVLDQARL
jgi:thiamine biosynthesis lipoprotein